MGGAMRTGHRRCMRRYFHDARTLDIHLAGSRMFAHFTKALVRPPARTFANGLTTVNIGVPDTQRAVAQHAAYCRALERHGCALTVLPADERFPDGTFVEDTALIIPGRGAIIARPGAPSREGEVEAIHTALRPVFGTGRTDLPQIVAPGTLDAGDVCEAGTHVFIGLSHRTNRHGAEQLRAWLATLSITSELIDIRHTPSILHLKSGVVALDERVVLAIDALATHPAFHAYDVLRAPVDEAYAANCVRVNSVVFVADGFPKTHAMLAAHGYALEILEMSEFEKMDGGLSCLSLRY
jgi:dimethylargininase